MFCKYFVKKRRAYFTSILPISQPHLSYNLNSSRINFITFLYGGNEMKSVKKNQKTLQGFVALLAICMMLFQQSNAAANTSKAAFANMPVKEITIFKDGHAFVLHEGKMPVGGDGNVTIDYLPRPIIGTFWAYSADSNAKLNSVVSQKRIVPVERTALTIPELIEGNIGAKVRITEAGLAAYETTIVGIPT
jgi:hypothetical protein